MEKKMKCKRMYEPVQLSITIIFFFIFESEFLQVYLIVLLLIVGLFLILLFIFICSSHAFKQFKILTPNFVAALPL